MDEQPTGILTGRKTAKQELRARRKWQGVISGETVRHMGEEPIAGAHPEGIPKRERYGPIGPLRIPRSIKLFTTTEPWFWLAHG